MEKTSFFSRWDWLYLFPDHRQDNHQTVLTLNEMGSGEKRREWIKANLTHRRPQKLCCHQTTPSQRHNDSQRPRQRFRIKSMMDLANCRKQGVTDVCFTLTFSPHWFSQTSIPVPSAKIFFWHVLFLSFSLSLSVYPGPPFDWLTARTHSWQAKRSGMCTFWRPW